MVSEYEDKAYSSRYPHCLNSDHSFIGGVWWRALSLVYGIPLAIIRMIVSQFLIWCLFTCNSSFLLLVNLSFYYILCCKTGLV